MRVTITFCAAKPFQYDASNMSFSAICQWKSHRRTCQYSGVLRGTEGY